MTFKSLFAVGRLTVGLLGLVAASQPSVGAEVIWAGPRTGPKLHAPPNQETSGLAASRRSPGMLWTHDDSGGEPVLYALRPDGTKAGALRLRGVRNDDWEDVAAYECDGKAWLIAGDVGDNDAKRKTVLLHVVEEPSPDVLTPQRELTVAPAWTLRVRYEDGPRDCESIAVDAVEGAVYLLTKREATPRLYRVPLAAHTGEEFVIAKHVGAVPQIPQPTAIQRKITGPLGKRRAEITAMDFAADRSGAVVLSYGAALYFPRAAEETWASALMRAPVVLPPHDLLQAEAICFSVDGKTIYLASEGPAPLLRYDRK